MATITSQTIVREGNATLLNNTVTHTVQTTVNMNETVVDGSTDLEFLLAIDVSSMKHFTLMADQALTVETNDGTTPQETFTLAANVPVIWNDGDTAILAGDITALYATNASGTDATLTVVVGSDLP